MGDASSIVFYTCICHLIKPNNLIILYPKGTKYCWRLTIHSEFCLTVKITCMAQKKILKKKASTCMEMERFESEMFWKFFFFFLVTKLITCMVKFISCYHLFQRNSFSYYALIIFCMNACYSCLSSFSFYFKYARMLYHVQ